MAALRAKRKKKKGSGGRFLLFLFAAALLTACFLLFRPHPSGRPPAQAPGPAGEGQKKPGPDRAREPGPTATPPLVPAAKTGKPLLAIIVDDMGYRQDTGRALIALDLPLSFAFLPFAPHNPELLAEASAQKREILLHQPMESASPGQDPGPGALYTGMNATAIRRTLLRNIQAVPGAIGLNNHMGSGFTANPAAMRHLLTALRGLDLFFVDSLTSPKSAAYELAGQLGIRAGRRDVFLDNEQLPEKIAAQLETLIALAHQRGQAVGICHSQPATLTALRRHRARLLAQTEMVGISRLLR